MVNMGFEGMPKFVLAAHCCFIVFIFQVTSIMRLEACNCLIHHTYLYIIDTLKLLQSGLWKL